jgi:hypothetical protein
MTNVTSAARALVVYALVLPLALVLGYVLATPTDVSSAGTIGIVLAVLAFPLVLRWHHQALFLSWGMTAVLFFLPGSPPFWLAMALLSLIISCGQRALSKEKQFIHEPSLMWPIIFLVIIVAVTAKATGGFGMRLFGSDVVGGKRYVYIFGGIAGYFAMSGQRIPPNKALLYLGLFFLGGLTDAIGTLVPMGPPEFYWLALIFPVSSLEVASVHDFTPTFLSNQGVTRFFGLTVASLSWLCYVLGRDGMRGLMSKPLRFAFFAAVLIVGCLGGFRSFFILAALTCLLVFYFEGLFRSRYFAWLILVFILVGAFLVAFSDRLPLSLQRTLSFLPVKIDPAARFDADISSEWRLQMWDIVLPEVPKHLWLGKGLGIDAEQLALTSELLGRSMATSQEVAMLAGDYHNGPLTVLIQFGVWGLIAWLWFLAAGFRALYLNFRHGDGYLKDINRLLLAYFLARIVFFFIVFGSFYSDVPQFCGILGLSMSLNNGIRRRERIAQPATESQSRRVTDGALAVPA